MRTISIDIIEKIVNCELSTPHDYLGMHLSLYTDIKGVSVNVFRPDAEKISVINTKTKEKVEMELIHDAGLFSYLFNVKKFFEYELEIQTKDGATFITRDPYSFWPTLSELDTYLFGQGTHYQIFDKLGAHLKVIDGVSGVSFAVWAPNAKRVSVIGSFNAWDGRIHPMRPIGSSGTWEIFIPNICEFDKYKFEIKTQEGHLIEKTDPYGNFQELRPSHSSLVVDLDKYKWQDEKWLKNRRKNKPLNSALSVYEVHLGSWKRVIEEDGNDRFMSYREYVDELIPYVKEMGYTHIELMPIEEHPFDGSWGYQVTGYFSPTSRFGSPDELMYFVDKCHQNNIGVILDWVPAHFPKDAHALARFDGTALYEHEDPRLGEHPDWGTLIFNYGRNEVKNFLIASAIFWLEKFHFDGIRVDAVASMLYLDYGKSDGNWVPNMYGGRENLDAVEFLRHMNSIILGKDDSILMIAEESTSWGGVSRTPEQGGLGFNLKWNMGWMNDFLRYIEEDPINRKYHHGMLTFSMVYAYTENFILPFSHDEVVHGKGSMINKMPGDMWQKFANLRLAYGFMYGHPGKKLLFQGCEFGQYAEWSESKSLDWHILENEQNKQLQNFVKDLNALYKEEPAFWYDDFLGSGFSWIECNDADSSLVSFYRKTEKSKDTLVFVCNFTPVPHTDHIIHVPNEGEYVEVLNSDDLKYGGSGLTNGQVLKTGEHNSLKVVVPPLGVAILKFKQK